MITGLGVDLIEVSRVAGQLGKPGFKELCFTAAERRRCGAGPGSARRYAALFAAKEAFFKAIGTGLTGLSLLDVEITAARGGRPGIILRGRTGELCRELRIGNFLVSMSLTGQQAGAAVIAHGPDERQKQAGQRGPRRAAGKPVGGSGSRAGL